ncbi:hypothetical protein OOK41_13835 [Micromonospora sp. NBC_01655]|nr:hypothetical protein [Micromonospora sp. NBC_01655]MCX4471376.1 hypothetical protein [Micromonospora sp. NBC_01655]
MPLPYAEVPIVGASKHVVGQRPELLAPVGSGECRHGVGGFGPLDG